MQRIRAVLFDIDGTLLDSNDAHAHAWLDALRGHGRSVPFELVRSKIGMGGDKLVAELAGLEDGSVEAKSIQDRATALLKAHYLPDVGPFPGARTLVERIRARGITIAIVTSAAGDVAADLLREAAVADLVDLTVTSADVDRSKPDPDLFAAALERLGVTASECVAIGDTPYDVEAATRAGVPILAFRCGGWDDDALAGAAAIYEGPQDLASNLEDSLVFGGHTEPGGLGRRPRRTRRSAAL